ncbi:hypothetical protein [Burkholderia thailandensis]|uniref:Secreted protein n=2 Tax=Burkholderia thailandensis TaxID=57975 RepID=Q2SWB6_BURTA|nr:hypothetical protein [Burkholderia thailandensis]ABC38748.1 hypothetical protein BTH_I2262 [Burkholderia thailandensis E264]AHI73174.1 hypothetical protein BTQ_1657 [Burkholderia thailandensis 2002721723]AHI78174.1 hypothetical protein BTJ_698 [Burkholderia thailandensis E444]AIC87588.1 hypothetical protein BTRA_2220 [Burkholderia thailandensis USAMRU Malaysia \
MKLITGIRGAALAAALATATGPAFAQSSSLDVAASAGAAEAASAAAAQADASPPAVPLKPNPAYARLPRYEGTVGGRPVVVRLGPKTDEPGVHGECQYLDTGAVVLLAGDRDGDTLEIEESDDGTNITGVWIGRFDASGTLSADRMNADQSDPLPVALRPAGSASAPSHAPGSQPAVAAGARQAGVRGQSVDGVANLRTAE